MLNKSKLQVILDGMVFTLLFVFALKYFSFNPSIFDLITIIAMGYVMVRNRDINTISLIVIIASVRVIDSIIFYNFEIINPFVFYITIAALNYIMVRLVHVRFMVLFRYGPSITRHHKGLTFTHQDAMMGWIYSAATALPALMLVEHSIRHLDWFNFKPLFFYTLYQPIQLLLAVATILVLYLMTYPKSAEARKVKAKNNLDA